jgi:hypothetical protein
MAGYPVMFSVLTMAMVASFDESDASIATILSENLDETLSQTGFKSLQCLHPSMYTNKNTVLLARSLKRVAGLDSNPSRTKAAQKRTISSKTYHFKQFFILLLIF